jgi:excisionase family DNA binding protein
MTQATAVSAATAPDKQKDGAELYSHRADETNGFEDKSGIARVIKVSPRTVDNLMRRRAIPFIRIGRVVRFDVARVKAALRRFEICAAGDREGARK